MTGGLRGILMKHLVGINNHMKDANYGGVYIHGCLLNNISAQQLILM